MKIKAPKIEPKKGFTDFFNNATKEELKGLSFRVAMKANNEQRKKIGLLSYTSTCCGAVLDTNFGEEGTDCYMCQTCKKPCDVSVVLHTKEPTGHKSDCCQEQTVVDFDEEGISRFFCEKCKKVCGTMGAMWYMAEPNFEEIVYRTKLNNRWVVIALISLFFNLVFGVMILSLI